MSRNVSEAANGSGEITSHIAGVAQGRNRYPEGRAAAGWIDSGENGGSCTGFGQESSRIGWILTLMAQRHWLEPETSSFKNLSSRAMFSSFFYCCR